jgi:hypothetical protein
MNHTANDNYEIEKNKPALLTPSEREWLYGRLKVSKAYEYRIKSDIKKKLHTFQQLELPLLVEKGFIISTAVYNNSNLSVYRQNLSANTQIQKSNKAKILPFKTKQGSLGRDLDPGPLPYQGNLKMM